MLGYTGYTHTPLDTHPLWTHTHPGHTPHPLDTTLDTHTPLDTHTTLSDTMAYGQPAGSMHPTGMHTCWGGLCVRGECVQGVCPEGCVCPRGVSGGVGMSRGDPTMQWVRPGEGGEQND